MDLFGINLGYLLVQIFNLLLIGGWFILSILALFQLRHQVLPETARAIWAALIILIPIVGAIAFWIVHPGERVPGAGEDRV
jgi:hypothetical protein